MFLRHIYEILIYLLDLTTSSRGMSKFQLKVISDVLIVNISNISKWTKPELPSKFGCFCCTHGRLQWKYTLEGFLYKQLWYDHYLAILENVTRSRRNGCIQLQCISTTKAYTGLSRAVLQEVNNKLLLKTNARHLSSWLVSLLIFNWVRPSQQDAELIFIAMLSNKFLLFILVWKIHILAEKKGTLCFPHRPRILITIIIITIIIIIIIIIITIISNSNWTKWSTIQGVIAWVISKWDEREARGRFEITSTITPWIVRHEVQLLINHYYNKCLN